MQAVPKYTRLRNAIIATILCFAILPMLLVGFFIPMQFTELYQQKTVREVESIASAKGRTIDLFFEERIAQLRTFTEMYTFNELTKTDKLADLLRILKANSKSYVDLGVIDMDGNHVTYAGAYDVRSANYKNEFWFAEVRRRGVFISDVFLGFRHFPHIIIAVMREEGDKAWILRATIDSEVFTSIVRAGRMSSKGDAFVVNRKGELQTDSLIAGERMNDTDVAWPLPGQETGIEPLMGKDMLMAKVPLTHAPWLLVVADDPAEHLSLLFKTKFMAFGLMFLGLVGLCVATWLVTRLIINRLQQYDRIKADYDATLIQSSKMAALGKLAAGVAHEVNNPLMLIREHAGWIRDLLEEEKPENIQHYQEIQNAAIKVEQNVDRAKEVTHRLLGFARRVDPTTESMPLNPIVEQAIAFLQSEAGYRHITIERNLAHTDPRVATDVGQLQQVILNIIDNAIDAVGENGVVAVSTALEGDQAVIRVRDNGPGIPEKDIEHIFDPFFTTKKPGEGTGLGLSICYSIMETLGGNLSAANARDGGAEFTVSLPAGRQ